MTFQSNNMLNSAVVLSLLKLSCGSISDDQNHSLDDLTRTPLSCATFPLAKTRDEGSNSASNFTLTSTDEKKSPPLQEQLDNAVSEYLKANPNIPAMYAFVSRNGKILACTANGYADKEKGLSASSNDALRIGSNSKVVTSTLFGLLIDKGVINWNTTVGEVFPDIVQKDPTNPAGKAKLWELLSHHSGIQRQNELDPSFKGLSGSSWRRHYIERALQCKTNINPGDTYIYGAGPIVAVAMVEKITGKSYEELMSDYICKPLGINSFVMGRASSCPRGYWLKDGVVEATHLLCNPQLANNPAGGVCLNMNDLAKVYALRAGDKLSTVEGKVIAISSNTVKDLNTVPYPKKDSAALGLFYEKTDGITWLGHAGDTGCGDFTKMSILGGSDVVCFFHVNMNRTEQPGIDHPEFLSKLRKLAFTSQGR